MALVDERRGASVPVRGVKRANRAVRNSPVDQGITSGRKGDGHNGHSVHLVEDLSTTRYGGSARHCSKH